MQGPLDNILTPPVLFFVLGAVATMVRSDLSIPEQIGRGLAMYLMIAIGFKGGVALRSAGLDQALVLTLIAGAVLALAIPLVAFVLARAMTKMNRVDAAAVAAHYGSVSVVTFAAATAMLDSRGIPWEGFMVAVLAAMEVPAIVVALLLGRSESMGKALHEALTNQSIMLLGGSLVIGVVTGLEGLQATAAVFDAPFKGVLAIFLLEMGLLATRRLGGLREAGWGALALAIVIPLLAGTCGVVAGTAIGLSTGGAMLLGVLAGSASYIAAPAALRLALPQANLSVPLGMSLGVTFPFNLVAGIPVYLWMSQRMAEF